MYNHNKAQQSKNRVHISWDILYSSWITNTMADLALSECSTSSTRRAKENDLGKNLTNKRFSFTDVLLGHKSKCGPER